MRPETYLAEHCGAEQINHAENMLAVMSQQTRIDVQMLSDVFEDNDRLLYTVGGTVRDYLMGRTVGDSADLDFATDAVPEETSKFLNGVASNVWKQGEKFGTIAAIINSSPYEITTLRSETYDPDSRKPEVGWGVSIEQDLGRRDFTINAIGVQFPNGALIDPHDGITDMENRILRTPLEPSATFSDDPLRMMRAARFMSQLNMDLEQNTRQAIYDMYDRIDVVASERIMPEVDKLLSAHDPTAGLELLWDSGLLERVLGGPMGEPAAVMSRVAAAQDVETRTVLLFSGCEEDLENRLRTCRWPLARMRRVNRTLKAARQALENPPQTDSEMRRWEHDAGDVAELAANAAEIMGSRHVKQYRGDLAAIGELRCEVPLDGKQIMEFVGLAPGPQVGHYKNLLQEFVFASGNVTEDDAYYFLRQNALELQQ